VDARERYKNDPTFHALVQMFLHLFESQLGSGAGVTPSEIRDASGLAWQLYHERHVDPIWIRPPN
jgi:hypothetical protein